MKKLESDFDSREEFLQYVYDHPYFFDVAQPELLIETQKHFKPELALFQGIQAGNRFFSNCDHDRDERKLNDGTIAYRIIGYANSTDEAQLKLDGRTWPIDGSVPKMDFSMAIPSNIDWTIRQ